MNKIIVLVILSVIVFMAAEPPLGCAVKAERMEKNYEFNYIGGCMVEDKLGVWIPMQNYHVVINQQ